MDEPVASPPARPPMKPRSKALVAGLVGVIVAGVVGLAVVLMARTSTPECTTRSYTDLTENAICVLEGRVELIDDANRALNAREITGEDAGKLDYFHLVDDAGRALIFFDVAKHKMPAAGAQVKVKAKVLVESAKATPRLVAESLD
ncbi:hypothetical protein [Chondromyces apiculatus]|nr:hypothetical protein [Chondromyces apiculatus]